VSPDFRPGLYLDASQRIPRIKAPGGSRGTPGSNTTQRAMLDPSMLIRERPHMATTGSSVQLSVFSVFCLPAVRGGMLAVHPIAAPCPPVGYCLSKRPCESLSPWMCRRRPCSRARCPNAHSFSERRIQHPAPTQARWAKRPRLGNPVRYGKCRRRVFPFLRCGLG